MTNEKIKRMLDACYQAKRIREMLPPLPEGIMSSHIRYMSYYPHRTGTLS